MDEEVVNLQVHPESSNKNTMIYVYTRWAKSFFLPIFSFNKTSKYKEKLILSNLN